MFKKRKKLLAIASDRKYNRCSRRNKIVAEKAKVGRPKIDEPRIKPITVRLTEAECARLVDYSKKHNITMTQVLMEGMKRVLDEEA